MELALQQSTDLCVFPHEEVDMHHGSSLLHSSANQSTEMPGLTEGGTTRDRKPLRTLRGLSLRHFQ